MTFEQWWAIVIELAKEEDLLHLLGDAESHRDGFDDGYSPVEELRETFASEGKDRLAVLADESRVAVPHRALLTAVANAALQAQRAVLDIRQCRPQTPTMFLVLSCVTINRLAEPNTELVIGQYGIDRTEQEPVVKHRGLGDDPAAYRVRHEQGRVVIEDDRSTGATV